MMVTPNQTSQTSASSTPPETKDTFPDTKEIKKRILAQMAKIEESEESTEQVRARLSQHEKDHPHHFSSGFDPTRPYR